MDVETAKQVIDQKGFKVSKTSAEIQQLKNAISVLAGAFLKPQMPQQQVMNEPVSKE